jgi:hypothetical protein
MRQIHTQKKSLFAGSFLNYKYIHQGLGGYDEGKSYHKPFMPRFVAYNQHCDIHCRAAAAKRY